MRGAQAFRYAPRPLGFSLIELMVVVLVVSLLAAIAVPTYQIQVRKGRRTDARTAVLDLAGREERYYAAANTYTTDSTQLGYTTAGNAWPQTVGSGYYQLNIASGTGPGQSIANSFVASAVVPAGSLQLRDTQCQYFRVDNLGNQLAGTSAATAVTNSLCWQ